jgi:hypothetical protein
MSRLLGISGNSNCAAGHGLDSSFYFLILLLTDQTNINSHAKQRIALHINRLHICEDAKV